MADNTPTPSPDATTPAERCAVCPCLSGCAATSATDARYEAGYRDGMRAAANEADAILRSFLADKSPNSPEWDRAQARIVAHLERTLRKMAGGV